MRSRPTKIALIGLMLSALLVTTGCAFGANQNPKHTLTIGATAEPVSMDPTASAAAAGPQVMLYNVYETLIKLSSDGKMVPMLAQRWEVSPDRLTYTFQLNGGAKFASGKPVDAAAVSANILRVRDQVQLAMLNKPMSVVERTEVVDADTLKVHLKRPSNDWLFNMTQTMGMIMDPDGFANLATQTAGSGPYQLARWDKGSAVVLAPNPKYWGTPPRFDEVTFRYFKDPNAMNAAMLSGGLDIVSNLQAPEAIDKFMSDQFHVLEGTTNGEVVLGLNNNSEMLKNQKVRQALTMAIDRAALMKAVWNNKGTLIGSMVPPTDPWYEDLSKATPYQPDVAKRLLTEAGYDGAKPLRFRVPALPYAQKAAQFVASQLKQVGVATTIEELLFPDAWLASVYTAGDYDLTIVAHVEPRDIVKFADPSYYWHYNNADFQRLIAEAESGDEATQIARTKQAAKLLSTDCAAIWLFLLPNLVVTKNTVSGVSVNATSLAFDVTGITIR